MFRIVTRSQQKNSAVALQRVTTDTADLKADGLDSETAFVAIVNGVIQAFIHVGVSQIGDNREETVGVIRFMGYERGARRVGQAVLEKAEDYLKTFNVSPNFCFPTGLSVSFLSL